MLFCYIENAKVVKKSGLLCMLGSDFLKINLSDFAEIIAKLKKQCFAIVVHCKLRFCEMNGCNVF
jgi:hypothetical protein